jgi:hypothetical protein
VENSRGPQAQEAVTKLKATRLRPFFCSFVDGTKDRENFRQNRIFAYSVRQFEAERDKAFEIISKLEVGEVKKLKRAKSVSEGLAVLRPGGPR